jgi:hypothetical protein
LQISEAQNKAAGEFVDLVATKLGSGRAVHSETAIASIARLAGSLLFRSFNLKVHSAEPGSAVLSNQANEEGLQLIGIMSAMLQHFGIVLDNEKLAGTPSKRGSATELSVLESLAMLQADAMQIIKTNKLNLNEAAQAAAIATAFVVKECSRDLGPEVSCNIATYGFIEGCKTVPPTLDAGQSTSQEKKPWYKLW